MKWLFIHRDFPGQYLHVIRHLVSVGDEVVGITRSAAAMLDGVRLISYAAEWGGSPVHPFVREFDAAVRSGLAVAEECEKLKTEGFVPDVVIGHSGWGEISFIKDVWPSRPLLGYFEFFYHATGADADFDPSFKAAPDLAKHLRVRNAISLTALEAADWGQTPTRWQRDRYPPRFHDRISVVHEGVDTDLVMPDPNARLWVAGIPRLRAGQPIVTYCARNLEPYRGFHIFMRALPRLLRELPDAQVLIVGGDDVSYGDAPQHAPTWRHVLLQEVGGEIDKTRVHFLGRLNFRQYLTVLQISAVHVYLTYPFVLSWSVIEAMSAGCQIVASRTPPVEEVVVDGQNGHLVDFFDTDGLADLVARLVRQDESQTVRKAARKTAVDHYDLKVRCLPAYLKLIHGLAEGKMPAEAK